jgi:hypothetical protein
MYKFLCSEEAPELTVVHVTGAVVAAQLGNGVHIGAGDRII